MRQIEWDIIERRLEGELAPEEELIFQEWYKARQKHRDYYHKVEQFHRKDIFFKDVMDQQLNNSWARFSKHRLAYRKRVHYWAGGIAVVCLLAGLFISHFLNPTQDALATAGTEGVILILSSGEQVNLSKNIKEIQEGNTNIFGSDSILSYERKTDDASNIQKRQQLRNSVETPLGGEYQINLEDGTVVYLSALSKLTYPVSFGKDKRVVRLSGEAYFDVRHDKVRPFIVEMDDMSVQVLGTEFCVRNYNDESFAEATLVSGRVKVWAGKDSCVLEPSYQFALEKNEEKVEIKKVDVEEFTCWREGKINIRNQRLEDVLERLSKWYNIEVFYLDEEAKDIRFYASVARYDTLDTLLERFEDTGLVQFIVKGNVLQVQSTGR